VKSMTHGVKRQPQLPRRSQSPGSRRDAERPGQGGLPGALAGVSYQVVQVAPLRENDVGLAWLLVHVPWKPSVMFAPGAIVPL
jgi:hypothetical protein